MATDNTIDKKKVKNDTLLGDLSPDDDGIDDVEPSSVVATDKDNGGEKDPATGTLLGDLSPEDDDIADVGDTPAGDAAIDAGDPEQDTAQNTNDTETGNEPSMGDASPDDQDETDPSESNDTSTSGATGDTDDGEDEMPEDSEDSGESSDEVDDVNAEDEKSEQKLTEIDKKNNDIILRDNYVNMYDNVTDFIRSIDNAEKTSVISSVTYSQVKQNLVKLREFILQYILMYYDNTEPDMNLYNYNYILQIMRINLEMIKKMKDTEDKISISTKGNTRKNTA